MNAPGNTQCNAASRASAPMYSTSMNAPGNTQCNTEWPAEVLLVV